MKSSVKKNLLVAALAGIAIGGATACCDKTCDTACPASDKASCSATSDKAGCPAKCCPAPTK